jgi:hypothetical protein
VLQATMTKERAVILLMIVVAAALLAFAVLTTGRIGETAATVTGAVSPAVDEGAVGSRGLVGAVLWWPEA